MRFRRASTATLAAASALALLAPVAAAQVPSLDLPAIPAVAPIAANPRTAVIPDQYHAIEAAIQQVAPPVVAATPAAAPIAPVAPKPGAAPKYHSAGDQYHSESLPDVTVTQTQPQNVNVSIRINSPGDDGPVVQVNGAGSDVETNVVQAPPAAHAPAPAAPDPQSGGGLPDHWTWIWTSACFGGSGPGAGLASVGPDWDWRWSCDAAAPGDAPLPDGFPGLSPGDVPSPAYVMPAGTLPPELAAASEPFVRPRPERSTGARRAHAPPPPAASPAPPPTVSGLLAAGPGVVAATRPVVAVAARATRAVRHAAEARARPARVPATQDLLPGAGGPSAGAASALGAALSLLLGTWAAVLVCALSLVIPRIWLRRWSGPPWRSPLPRSARLERPG